MRKIYTIAREIQQDWQKVNYAALPYLNAMMELSTIADMYYEDNARSIILYFLSNSGTWKGENAKRIKAELKGMIK